MIKNKKFAFLSEIPTHYRDSLFEKLLRKENLDFEVLYCARAEYARDWKQEQKIYPYKILPGASYTIIRNGIFVLKINPGIWHQLSKARYDAVIIGGYIQPTMQLGILWCLLNKVPYILWSESHNLNPGRFWKRLIKWPLVKFAVNNAAAFLVMGTNSRNYLISYGAEPDKIFSLPNVPNVEKMALESARLSQETYKLREKLDISGNPIIVYVGRLIDAKNIKTLLFAFHSVQKEIPGAGLVIAGTGPRRSFLEHLAKKLGLSNLCFAGFIQPGDLPKYYACADIFVLPSVHEAWGVVVLEAMSCGLPVVVSDKVGCASDLVYPQKTGFIVPAESVDKFASAFIGLLRDKDLRKQIGRQAQELALKWNYDTYIPQLESALTAALAKEKDVRN